MDISFIDTLSHMLVDIGGAGGAGGGRFQSVGSPVLVLLLPALGGGGV